MGGDGPVNGIFVPLLLAVGLSALLVVIGFLLHRRGYFVRRGPALAWAVLTILPLFGAGAAMFVAHMAEKATGATQSGNSQYSARGAP